MSGGSFVMLASLAMNILSVLGKRDTCVHNVQENRT